MRNRLSSTIGDTLAFHRDPLALLTRVAREGPLVRFYLGRSSVYLVSDPELVQRVVAADQKAFVKGASMETAKVVFGEGLLSSGGELHRRQRRLIQPLFHRELIAAYAAGMTEATESHQRQWRDGEQVDLQREMRRVTIAILGRALFSSDLRSEADRISEAVGDAVGFTRLMLFPGPTVLKLFPLPLKRQVGPAKAALEEIIDRLLQEHLLSSNGRTDLLTTLLDPEANGTSPKGVQQVRDEAMTMLLAGHETTATTTALGWYLLSTNPAQEERFHAELDSVLGGRAPGAEDLERLPYTRAIVKETLRLYPASWIFGRSLVTDFELGGELLPARAGLLVSPWVIHRSPELYEDPAAFRPERWVDGSTEGLPKYSFLPFGGGQRKCIGENFSQTEMAIILATVGQSWRMRVSRRAVDIQPLFTLQPAGGVPATLYRRGANGGSRATRPAQEPDRVENGESYWDEVVPIWDGGGEQRLWREHSDAVNRDLVARWVPDGAATILKTDLWDEAMGEGICPALSSKGAEVSGIDVSAEIVAAAAERHPGIDAHRADVRSLPFPDGTFDAVVSNSSLDHFTTHDEIRASITELRRVMRSGGRSS